MNLATLQISSPLRCGCDETGAATCRQQPEADAAEHLQAAAKIAIIDDEPVNIKVVRKHLQGVGYRNFITTTESPSAMALLASEMPDVVLLDVMMPSVDGIQILQEIRACATEAICRSSF